VKISWWLLVISLALVIVLGSILYALWPKSYVTRVELYNGTPSPRSVGPAENEADTSNFAQNSVQYSSCSVKATSQRGLDECANEEAERVDKELNLAYAQLALKAKCNSAATTKSERVKHIWQTYRDSYIAAMYPAESTQATYGTMYPMEVDLLYAKLTRQQLAAMTDLLQQYSRGLAFQRCSH